MLELGSGNRPASTRAIASSCLETDSMSSSSRRRSSSSRSALSSSSSDATLGRRDQLIGVLAGRRPQLGDLHVRRLAHRPRDRGARSRRRLELGDHLPNLLHVAVDGLAIVPANRLWKLRVQHRLDHPGALRRLGMRPLESVAPADLVEIFHAGRHATQPSTEAQKPAGSVVIWLCPGASASERASSARAAAALPRPRS